MNATLNFFLLGRILAVDYRFACFGAYDFTVQSRVDKKDYGVFEFTTGTRKLGLRNFITKTKYLLIRGLEALL